LHAFVGIVTELLLVLLHHLRNCRCPAASAGGGEARGGGSVEDERWWWRRGRAVVAAVGRVRVWEQLLASEREHSCPIVFLKRCGARSELNILFWEWLCSNRLLNQTPPQADPSSEPIILRKCFIRAGSISRSSGSVDAAPKRVRSASATPKPVYSVSYPSAVGPDADLRADAGCTTVLALCWSQSNNKLRQRASSILINFC
jgi:hypothetical protein